MSDKDDLAKLITSHTVSWDQACLIAESILDGGWGSPDDLARASEYSYDEAMESVMDRLEQHRKVQKALIASVPDADTLQLAREGIDAGGPMGYGTFEAWICESLLSLVKREIDLEDNNPFRPSNKKKKRA